MTTVTSNPAKVINVIGMDPSMNNWGLAYGTYDLQTKELKVKTLGLICPVLPKGKQIRQNSLDLVRSVQLYQGAREAMQLGAHAVFVEVPVGSQNARASVGYGICVGVLGALKAEGFRFYELNPTEVKLAATGNPIAKKKAMIAWATKAFPEANWPTYKEHGVELLSEAQAEHMADACGAIKAGIASDAFQQTLSMTTVHP